MEPQTDLGNSTRKGMTSKQDPSVAQARLNRLFAYIGRPPSPKQRTPLFSGSEQSTTSEPGEGQIATTSIESPSTDNQPLVTEGQKCSTHQAATGESSPSVPGLKQHESTRCNLFDSTYMAGIGDATQQQFTFHPFGKSSSKARDDLTVLREPFESQAEISTRFCSYNLLAKFPYKYMDDSQDAISQRYFSANKFYARRWTLFSLTPPASIGGKPLVMVPFEEAHVLIREISRTFNIKLSVPPFPFTITFYHDSMPQPSLLGVSRSRDDSNTLQQNISREVSVASEIPHEASTEMKETFNAWQYQISSAQKVWHSRNKQKCTNKIWGQSGHARDVEQVQKSYCYLGLSTELNAPAHPANVTHAQTPIDSVSLVKVPFDKEVVIVCIDVESDERNHDIITEIGISVLDTHAIKETPAGIGGNEWTKHIQSSHLRVQGTQHIRNSKWCMGNPDSFEYGQTEWLTANSVSSRVDEYFGVPSSSYHNVDQHKPIGGSVNTSQKGEHVKPEVSSLMEVRELPQKPIVILGHDVLNDIQYLSKLGCKAFDNVGKPSLDAPEKTGTSQADPRSNIIDILDTAVIDKVLRKDTQSRNLAKICQDMDMTTWNLHNAGNDARYTLEAFIKMMIRSRGARSQGVQE